MFYTDSLIDQNYYFRTYNTFRKPKFAQYVTEGKGIAWGGRRVFVWCVNNDRNALSQISLGQMNQGMGYTCLHNCVVRDTHFNTWLDQLI